MLKRDEGREIIIKLRNNVWIGVSLKISRQKENHE